MTSSARSAKVRCGTPAGHVSTGSTSPGRRWAHHPRRLDPAAGPAYDFVRPRRQRRPGRAASCACHFAETLITPFPRRRPSVHAATDPGRSTSVIVLDIQLKVGPTQEQAFIDMYHQEYVPALRRQTGYLGSLLLRVFPPDVTAEIGATAPHPRPQHAAAVRHRGEPTALGRQRRPSAGVAPGPRAVAAGGMGRVRRSGPRW